MENSNVSNYQGIYNPARYVNCTMQSKKSMSVLLVRESQASLLRCLYLQYSKLVIRWGMLLKDKYQFLNINSNVSISLLSKYNRI